MLQKIADRINKQVSTGDYEISRLQEYRDTGYKKLFQIASKETNYIHHIGGRTEAQFNIATENLPDIGKVFRYGVAFSLESSQYLYDPIAVLQPKVELFNAYVSGNGKIVSGLKMWCVSPDRHTGVLPASTIPLDWIQYNNFIFIGNYWLKSLDDITDSDIRNIVEVFDRLMPAYLYVEENAELGVSDKVSKICWNTSGRVKPSGIEGKSKDKKSHENMYRYGHEEWLFDFDKLVDGYHYSYFESVNKAREKYEGKLLDIDLYTAESSQKSQYYWVAKLSDVEVIDRQKELSIIEKYKQLGWLEQMRRDLENASADVDSFDKWVAKGDLFNIRFRPEDVQWYGSELLPMHSGDSISNKRYKLLNKNTCILPDLEKRDFVFSGLDVKETGKKIQSHRQRNVIECSQLHSEIQNMMAEYLRNEYIGAEVKLECGTQFGTKIDIGMLYNDEYYFFEVKAYSNAKLSIREALGQLIEYSYYPNKQIAKQIVIVTNAKLNALDKEYLEFLRNTLSLPVGYIQFDMDMKKPAAIFHALDIE